MRRYVEIFLICLGVLLIAMAAAILQRLPPGATFLVIAIGGLIYLGVRTRRFRARQARMNAVFARARTDEGSIRNFGLAVQELPNEPPGIRHTDFAAAANVSYQEALLYLEGKAREEGVESINEYEQGGCGWVRFPFPDKASYRRGNAVP
jgi:hypothetical protein